MTSSVVQLNTMEGKGVCVHVCVSVCVCVRAYTFEQLCPVLQYYRLRKWRNCSPMRKSNKEKRIY